MLRRLSLLALTFLAVILLGCDAFDNSEENAPDLSVVEEPSISEFDVAVAAEKEDQALAASVMNNGRVDYATYADENQNSATVFFGDDGLPQRLVVGESVLVFENYGQNTVDIAVATSEGEVETVRDVDLPDQIGDLRAAVSANASKKADPDAAEAVEAASLGMDLGICLGASAAVKPTLGATLPAAISSCGSFLLSSAAQITENESVEFGVTAWNLAWCKTGEASACVGTGMDVLATELEEANETEEEREEDVAQGTGALRFAGVWGYPDRQDDWFVVEKNKAFDALRDEGSNCYDVNVGDYVSVDGNVFTYERREDGAQIELEYNRLSEENLRVRRLSDGLTYTMELNSEGDGDTYLNNRCGSSSTSSSSKLIGR